MVGHISVTLGRATAVPVYYVPALDLPNSKTFKALFCFQ